MTAEQFGTGLLAFLILNIASVWAIAKWGIGRAIAYTHLERDVKELQKYRDAAEAKHEKVLNDMKGLSIKINTIKEECPGGKSI